jgi:hypothetical protein
MKPSTHALTLKSTKSRIIRGDHEVILFRSECSCGALNPELQGAPAARAWHAAHLQQHLGPEAQEARERAS